jgi:hypothetical protein
LSALPCIERPRLGERDPSIVVVPDLLLVRGAERRELAGVAETRKITGLRFGLKLFLGFPHKGLWHTHVLAMMSDQRTVVNMLGFILISQRW